MFDLSTYGHRMTIHSALFLYKIHLHHILHYSKLRKNVHVTQSQNVPLSCLSQPLADRLAEAAYRDILGLSYARAFPQLGVLPAVAHIMLNFKCSGFTHH